MMQVCLYKQYKYYLLCNNLAKGTSINNVFIECLNCCGASKEGYEN